MWSMSTVRLGIAAGASFLMSCATGFTGSPHVEDGRMGCERKCRAQAMEVAGMVYMGEYSSACVCAPPAAAGSTSRMKVAVAGGVGGGVAGVIMQMQEAERQRQQSTYLSPGR